MKEMEQPNMEMKIDEALRKQAREVFEKSGLTEEAAITLFYKRTVACGRMPFTNEKSVKSKKKKPRMNERFAEWDAF